MGGGGLGVAAEDAHFRFELLDAIAEGETAMAAVRVTVLDTALLEEAFGAATVSPGKFLEEGGSFLDTGTTPLRSTIMPIWTPRWQRTSF